MSTARAMDLWRPSDWGGPVPSWTCQSVGDARHGPRTSLQSQATVSRKRRLDQDTLGYGIEKADVSGQWAGQDRDRLFCPFSSATNSWRSNPTIQTGVAGRRLPYLPSPRLDSHLESCQVEDCVRAWLTYLLYV